MNKVHKKNEYWDIEITDPDHKAPSGRAMFLPLDNFGYIYFQSHDDYYYKDVPKQIAPVTGLYYGFDIRDSLNFVVKR